MSDAPPYSLATRLEPARVPVTPPPAPEDDHEPSGLAFWWGYRRDILGAAGVPLAILGLFGLVLLTGSLVVGR